MAKQIKSKSDQVVDQILQMVLDGELEPGDRIPVESALADHFGVSRITIREAFKKLSIMGLVDIRQGEGTFVSQMAPDCYMRPLLPMLILDEQDVGQLYDARLFIENGIAVLAARNRSDADVTGLWDTHRIMKENFGVTQNQRIYSNADKEFHMLLAKASGNHYLIRIYDTINDLLTACINKTGSLTSGRIASLREHAAMIEAVEAQDEARASEMMTTHILNAKRFWLEALK